MVIILSVWLTVGRQNAIAGDWAEKYEPGPFNLLRRIGSGVGKSNEPDDKAGMADHGHCSFGMVNGSRGKTRLPMIGQLSL